jgi:hypothetical protein
MSRGVTSDEFLFSGKYEFHKIYTLNPVDPDHGGSNILIQKYSYANTVSRYS